VKSLFAAIVALSLLSCGDPETSTPTPDPTLEFETPDVVPAPTALRRLTSAQYRNSVHDLFGAELVIPPGLEPDVEDGGLISLGAALASISPRGVEQYEAAAYSLAEQAMTDPAVRGRIVACQPETALDSACAAQFIREFGLTAWRRPLEEDEVTRLTTIAMDAALVRDDFYGGLEFAIAGLLQSPFFLFRGEIGADGTFNDFEIATRLSFFVWNTTPDPELLAAAMAGELSTDEGLRGQSERLLASPRARAGVRNMFSEIYRLHALDKLSKDPTIFEHMSPEVGPAAREETLLGVEHLVFDTEADFRDIYTTRTTFLNRKLASIYNVRAPSREGFGMTRLPEDGPRRGLLGQISMLALASHAVSSSATLRGAYVRETVLCHEIPNPPSNVDTSIPEPSPDAPTLRARVAVHLEDPYCASCHTLMDPIGLAYENFDGLGRYRETDNGHAIDASGQLDGVEFDGPAQLGTLIHNHEDTGPCVARHVYRYATGHHETEGEAEVLDDLAARFEASGYRVTVLMLETIMSPGFRQAGAPR
jgi:hypothetical protein